VQLESCLPASFWAGLLLSWMWKCVPEDVKNANHDGDQAGPTFTEGTQTQRATGRAWKLAEPRRS
jgi:hypothetical protein